VKRKRVRERERVSQSESAPARETCSRSLHRQEIRRKKNLKKGREQEIMKRQESRETKREKVKKIFFSFSFRCEGQGEQIQLVNFVPRAKTQRNSKSTENKDEILLLFLVLFFLPPSLLYHRFDRCSVLLFRGTDRRRNRVIDRLREQRRCFKLWNETID